MVHSLPWDCPQEPRLRVNVCVPHPVRFTVAKAEGAMTMDQLPPAISVPPDTLSDRSDNFSRDDEPSRYEGPKTAA